MNIYEVQEYAKDHGFDSVNFIMVNRAGRSFEGRFLDAYFGMIAIPEISSGFILLSDLIKEYGIHEFEFYVEEN